MNSVNEFEEFGPPRWPPQKGDARRRLKSCADKGLMRHVLPTSVGGFGDSYRAMCERHERLGEATYDPGLVLALNAHLWGAVFPILHFGNETLKADLLPRMAAGELIGGHAITEPGAGSDLQAMETRAERAGDGFRLSGIKRYITNAPIADMLVVYARVDAGLAAFLVRCEDAGAHFTGDSALLACAGGTIGEVVLNDCLIDENRLLGKLGAGGMMMQRALELERAFIFAGIVGVMEWQLRQVVDYSRQRRVGGAHLGKNQAISHRIADMKVRTDTTRLWVRECARLADAGQRISLASAQTKLFAAEAFLQSSLDAVQILGAYGLEASQPLARLVHDALGGRLFSGSSEIQRNIIASLLGTGDGYRGSQR